LTGPAAPRAAHWIAEENPDALVEGLRAFIEKA
jgi:hypothetical protein